jgi:hypothetical protein
MSDQREEWGNYPSVRELYGKTSERARSWALAEVEEIVERKIRGRCWPIPVRDGTSHKLGWAFDSLLGVMWLQMLWLMLGQPRRCEWCGKLLDVDPDQEQGLRVPENANTSGRRKPRRDRRFCPSRDGVKNKCKADWNYHASTRKSSKHARKEYRDRRRGKS